MEDYSDSKRELKKYIIYAFLAVLAVLAVIFIPKLFSGKPKDDHVYEDAGATDERTEGNSFVTLRNLDFLYEFMGSTENANIVMNTVQNKILADFGDSPQTGVEAALMPASLIESIYFPFNVKSFLLEVSNGKYYNVQVAVEDEMYFGIFIKESTANGEKVADIYVVFSAGLAGFNDKREVAINKLVKWAGTLTTGGIMLSTIDMLD